MNVSINGVVYFIQPQLKINKTLTTELDTYEFTLYSDNKIDLDFSKYNGLIPVVINSTYNTYLSNYNCEVVSYNTTKRYKYVIQCVSALFKLQRIVSANRTITQPINANKRSIYFYLNRINASLKTGITLDSTLQTKLNIPCPEMQFTKSTFYEIVCALFDVANLLPYMDNYNTLKCIDKAPVGASVDFDVVKFSNNAAEYADAFDIDIENAISKDTFIKTFWIKPTSDEAMLTAENMIWELPANIYEIRKVEIYGTFRYDDNTGGIFTDVIDITDNVIEEQVYNTLKVSNSNNFLNSDYKRANLYYTRGDNKIKGASFNESTWLANLSSSYALVNAAYLNADEEYQTNKFAIPEMRKVLMRVEYQSEADNTRVIIKRNGVSNVNSMINQQNDAYIDAVNFGKMQKENIERLGTEKATGIKRGNLYNLGDKYNDYVITSYTSVINDNVINTEYNLSKNYIYNTGRSVLNQIKRFTAIDKNNVLIRNENLFYNFKIGFVYRSMASNLANLAGELLHFNTHYNYATDHLLFINYSGNLSKMYYMQSSNKVIGNNILLQFAFYDNISIGKSVDNASSTIKAYYQAYEKYADSKGEFDGVTIYVGAGGNYKINDNFDVVKKYPAVTSNAVTGDVITDASEDADFIINNNYVYKDNRETLNMTIQFNVESDDKRLFLYDQFYKLNKFVCDSVKTLKFYTSTTQTYNDYSAKPVGSIDDNIELDFENRVLTISGFENENIKSFAITDNDDKLIMAINTNINMFDDGVISLYIN